MLCTYRIVTQQVSKIQMNWTHFLAFKNISALVQIMTWRRPGDKPLPEPIMVSLLTHICITWLQWVNSAVLYAITINTLRLRQNGRHFTDAVFKSFFLNENFWIGNNMSLKCVPQGLINNISLLVQVMAYCRSGDKPLSEPMMALITDAYMRHSASMSNW